MTTDTTLIEKREELKRRLAVGEYRTFIDVTLDWSSFIIQKITCNPYPICLGTLSRCCIYSFYSQPLLDCPCLEKLPLLGCSWQHSGQVSSR